MSKKSGKSFKGYVSFLFILAGFFMYSQETTISGTVVSSDDTVPIPGVNVVIEGTTVGTATDFDGNYSIVVPNDSAVLTFSYLGYLSQNVTVGNKNVINVTLQVNQSQLDEVIVIGYGTQAKSDITGSVSSVKSEELNAFPVLNAEQALQGRAAGVVVQTNNGGEPGAPIAIRVRGTSSIGANSDPLIVVDGFVGAQMPLAADIASMEVLKDASATAIYGSRGSGGVIMVTTKRGRVGRSTIELNSSYSGQSVTERYDLLNADQFATFQNTLNPGYVQGPANTDWQDLIFTAGYVSNHQLSFSGASDKINYYVSGNYFDQKGVVINSDFERFSFLSNVEVQASDRLKIGMNLFADRSDKDGVLTQSPNGNVRDTDVISGAYRFAPDLGVQDENGENTQQSVGDFFDNPVATALETDDETIIDNFRANFFGDYRIFDGLSFKSTFGFSANNRRRGNFKPSTLIAQAGAEQGIAFISNGKTTELISENYLTYEKTLGKGDLTALLGYSYQKSTTEGSTAASQGFISDGFSFRNLGGASTFLQPSSFFSEREIISQFARLNYDYDNRYLLTFTARRDGASNFARNNKYAFFPSGAIGWKISEEAFLKDNETLSNLKLRASYGVTGNPGISPYQSLARFNTKSFAFVGDQPVIAIVPGQPANNDLKWESSYQSNFGLDLGLFNDRISLTADYYIIDTEDLILEDAFFLPDFLGFDGDTVLRNVGEIRNEGVEISLTTRNVAAENFSWTTNLNWSRNRNTVQRLLGEDSEIFSSAAPGTFGISQSNILRVGEPVGSFWGYEYRGVNQGTPTEGTAGFDGFQEAGDELFTDVLADGVITTDDQMIIGDPNPDWTAGLNNDFSYKGLDLNIFFQAAVGGDIINYTLVELASGTGNATTDVLNAWTPTNTDTDVPSNKVRTRRNSTRFVYDGSYLRLKNIALGYNLPSDLVSRIGMQGIRVSVSGQNILTFTNYPGIDPEVSYKSESALQSNVNRGFDYGGYPNVKSYTMSVNLKF